MLETSNSSLFISHASEDKISFVRPLVDCLKNYGIDVWYDEFSLKVGDSIKENIENGIKSCSFGLVILSNNFFEKKWTKKELSALFSKELIKDEVVILPIWYKVSLEEVFNFSPFLADKLALIYDGDIEKVAQQILDKLNRHSEVLQETVERTVNIYKSNASHDIDLRISESSHRLDKYFFCMNELNALYFNNKELKKWKEDEYDQKYDEFLIESEGLAKQIRLKLPLGVHEWYERKILKNEIAYLKAKVKKWIRGSMTQKEAYELLYNLDVWLDADYTYILFGIANYCIPDHGYIHTVLGEIGCRNMKKTELKGDKDILIELLHE